MSSGNRGASRWPGALAGLEAGIVGALVLLGYLMLDSALKRRSVWSISNLLATTFYGSVMSSGFSTRTWSGLALLIVLYGLLGALFSLLAPHHLTRSRVTLLGLLLGVAWFYLSFGVLWTHVNPWVPLESPVRAMWVGHVLYGGVMGWCLGRPRDAAARES